MQTVLELYETVPIAPDQSSGTDRELRYGAGMILTAIAIAICPAPPARRVTCVVDGDTVWIEREKNRLLDIDAPEMKGDCPAESAQAIRARDRLVVLLRGRELSIERKGTDRYGRTLARLGDSGDQLVREGLARRWGYRRGWCG